jgi:hypothetical protein
MRMRSSNSNSSRHHVVNYYSERKLFIVFFVLMVALIVDNSFSINADILRDQIVSFWGVVLFVAIFAVYAFGQFFILEMVKAKNRQVLSGSIGNSENVITIAQYALTSIFVIVILEVLFISQYHRDLLIASTTISYVAAIFLTALLTWKLFSWYKVHKKQSLVLLFGLAAAGIALTSITYLFWSDAVLATKASVIFPESEVSFNPGYEEDSPLNLLDYVLHSTLTAFVLLLWGGTVVLLYHNFKRIGQVKFWVLVTLPVVSFMGILTVLYQELAPTSLAPLLTPSNLMIPIWLLYYSGLSMGIIIGLAFILIGRFLKHGTHSRDYMIITGFGFMIFIWAYSAILTQTAYPPYGIATVSALPLSLFMILNGLSYSAISVAQDQTLRRSIRKSVKDMKFLESIGTAQMEQELQKRVLTIAKENSDVMTEETGVQPSLTEDEMKEYLNMVANEINRAKHDTMQRK